MPGALNGRGAGSARGVAALLVQGHEGGGTLRSTCILYRHMPADVPLRVAALSDGPLTRALRDLGAEVALLGSQPVRVVRAGGRLGVLKRLWRLLWNTGWVVCRAAALAAWVRRSRVRIVHTGPGYGAIAACLARRFVRFILVCHWRHPTLSTWRRFRRLLAGSADRFLAISRAVKQSLPDDIRARTQVIHNAIEVEEVSREARERRGELRRRLGVPGDVPLVVCLGTYAEPKAQHLLVEAMAHVAARRRDALCAFIGRRTSAGSAAYLDRLKARAGELGLGGNCRFLLAESVPRARAALADANVFCAPTWNRGFGEGFGLVFAEAMACGLPVVAFAVGAHPEIVDNEVTGLLVPGGDAGALAGAIVALLDDPDRARRMGAAGLARVRRCFDAPRVAREVADVYRALCPGLFTAGGEGRP